MLQEQDLTVAVLLNQVTSVVARASFDVSGHHDADNEVHVGYKLSTECSPEMCVINAG